MSTLDIKLFCDGAAKKNRDGSFGSYILIEGEEKSSLARPFTDVTNNQMELMGFIHPMTFIYNRLKDNNADINITVVSDSQYLIKGVNEWMENWKRNGWKTASRKAVMNKELWIIVNDLIHNVPNKLNKNVNFNFVWTKGHTKIDESSSLFKVYNDKCDKLANDILINTSIDKYRNLNEHVVSVSNTLNNFL